MSDYEYKSRGDALLRRLVGRCLSTSRRQGRPAEQMLVSIPFDKAVEIVNRGKRWDKKTKELREMADILNDMLYDPNVDWVSKQKKLKTLVNSIYTTISIIEETP